MSQWGKHNKNPLLQMKKTCKGTWRLSNVAQITGNEASWFHDALLPSTWVTSHLSGTQLWETSSSWNKAESMETSQNTSVMKIKAKLCMRVCMLCGQYRARTSRLCTILGPLLRIWSLKTSMEPEDHSPVPKASKWFIQGSEFWFNLSETDFVKSNWFYKNLAWLEKPCLKWAHTYLEWFILYEDFR